MSKVVTKDDFLKRAKQIHGNKYDYSKIEFDKMYKKICIICPEHGEFWQTPQDHLSGRGCPKCGFKKTRESKIKTFDDFVEKAKQIHGDKYDYSKVTYSTRKEKVCIICPKHGEFWQTPQNHLSGRGCPKCANEKRNNNRRITFNEFVERANKIHNFKYSYVEKEINNEKEKIGIICPIHGEFLQEINAHLHGCGCPKCGVGISKQEQEIINFLKEKGVKIEERKRDLIENSHKEIDIFLPDYNIGIEYNGLRWHSDEFNKNIDYHVNKTDECNKKGIRLIQIFEDEWVLKKDIVKSKLTHILHIDYKEKIMGRKCTVKEISKELAKKFLDKNHIQGYSRSTINIGAFYGESLIGVASFIKYGKDYILNRLATEINYTFNGVCSKLISFFEKNYEYNNMITYADRRWVGENNVYNIIGFKIDGFIKPSYTYRYGNKIKRMHKFNFRKKILHKKYGLPLSMTENEMTKKLNFYKIYDCGLIKYKKKRDSFESRF